MKRSREETFGGASPPAPVYQGRTYRQAWITNFMAYWRDNIAGPGPVHVYTAEEIAALEKKLRNR